MRDQMRRVVWWTVFVGFVFGLAIYQRFSRTRWTPTKEWQ